jgi:hypothetical protein
VEGKIMAIVTVGIDLAKNAFAVHGVDEADKPALVRPEVPRAKLVEFIANVPPSLKPLPAPTCALYPLKAWSSNPSCLYIAPAKAM